MTSEKVDQVKENEVVDPSKLLIIGANGFVGGEVLRLLGYGIPPSQTPTKEELNITDKKAVLKWLESQTGNVLINFAAFADVDGAEAKKGDETGEVWRTNAEGPKNIAEAARKTDKFLVQISTDFVFPGDMVTPGPYEVDSKYFGDKSNLGWYGYTKLEGERAVLDSGARSAIVRISYPFGSPHDKRDFSTKVLGMVENGYPLFADQRFTPTYIPDLAEGLKSIVTIRATGVFHVATHPVTTPYKFGTYITDKKGINLPEKGLIVNFMKNNPTKAKRPVNGGLSCERTQFRLGLEFHTWQQALDEMYS